MKSSYVLQDILLLVTKELEKKLASELDDKSIPPKRFSSGYKKRKRLILYSQNGKTISSFYQWRFLILIITLLVLINCGIVNLK